MPAFWAGRVEDEVNRSMYVSHVLPENGLEASHSW
jgi:hypothetical protein